MTLTKAKYLLDDEYRRLEDITTRFMATNERDCLLLKLAMATGARASEILAVRKCDLVDNSVYIRGLKGSNDRELPLKRPLYQKLQRYASKVDGELLFPIGYRHFCHIWHTYRPAKKKLHSIRHTFALRIFKRTKNIHLVKTALGHKSLLNTQIYMDYVYSQTELRRAIA